LRHAFLRRRSTRLLARTLTASLVLGSMPVAPAQAAPRRPAPTPAVAGPAPAPSAAPSPTVHVNRTVPAVTPVPLAPVFSDPPTDAELFRARVFAEPFVPSGPTTVDENRAFAAAITQYVQGGNNEDVTPLGTFLSQHPTSAWRGSLLMNLGAHYQRKGYFTRAETALGQAWALARTSTDARGQAMAGRALAELLDLQMRFGHLEQLKQTLSELGELPLHGSAADKTAEARRAVYILTEAHHQAISSAAVSVDKLAGFGKPGHFQHPEVARFHGRPEGASLADTRDLAARTGLSLQMVYRPPSASVQFVVGSIVHLKQGHFSALVKQDGEHYMLADPAFAGEEFWISRAALQEESSGYALIPPGPLPEGWRAAGAREVASIRGKCFGTVQGPGCQGENCIGPSGGSAPCPGLATYAFHSFLASLLITDTPVGYTPPRGPAVQFTMSYHQREGYQPQIFTYSNIGRRWSLDWLSYLEDDPNNLNATVTVYPRGGSKQTYTGFDGSSFALERTTRQKLTRLVSSPIRYELASADGSKLVFTHVDGGVSPRRVFMTEARDPQGNRLLFTYDAQLRLVSVSDAIDQVTTLSYELTTDPLKVTKVTDPFGRSAKLEYDASGALVRITDVIGIVSQFEYGVQDFIRALTTPYGTTTFAYGNANTQTYYWDWWLEATDPLGGKERIEWVWDTAAIPATGQASTVPTGFVNNQNLNVRNSFYWDKRATMLHPGDYTKAHIRHWLYAPASVAMVVDSLHSEKKPLENRVWYGQVGESIGEGASPQGRAAKLGRVLDDGASQIYRYEYNPLGKVTRATDPLGRTKTYVYDTNGIDLKEMRRVNGQNSELLQSLTFNAQHEPLTVMDAAGQVTTYTYNAQGQVATIVTPPRDGLSQAQRTTTYTYDQNGFLESVTGPLAGPTTSYTYDGYGRVRTVTDPDGYVLTYDYDALDRPTKVTYPDATFEQTVYNRLDAEQRRDRIGRWSRTFHDALRRPVASRDATGRTVSQEWCNCGSLDKLIDANGNATTWERDLQGRITKEIRPNGSFKELTYETTTSRRKKVKDAKNQETNYSYYLDDKLQQTSYTNAQIATPAVSFIYDPVAGRLATMSDGAGTSTYAYHPVTVPPSLGADQLASVDGPLANDTVSYTYDELARVKTRTLNGVTTSWTYDALGRLTTLADPLGNFTYTYVGTTGRTNTVTYPNGQTTSYAYLPVNQDLRLQEIHHKKPGGTTLNKYDYTYDAVGDILTWAQQTDTNPAQTYTFEYDRADQLAAATLSAATPKRYRYAYDPAGNRTVEQMDDAATLATYDNMNRLTTQVPGGGLVFRGTLSEPATVTVGGQPATVGGTNQFSGTAQVPQGTSQATVQAIDPAGNVRTNVYELTQTGATKSFTYDGNGNLTGDGTKTYEWDAGDRLVAVKQGVNTLASFTYDGARRRATKTSAGVTRSYIYDATQVLEERPTAGVTKRFIFGPGIDQLLAEVASGTATYSVADHLGSIARTTDASGTPSLTREYDPWGNPLQGSATGGYAFTGREWDAEAGTYYYRARYYDPKLGRFLSEDPIGLDGGVNRYAYVGSSPTTTTDPSGTLPRGPVYECGPCTFQFDNDPIKGPHVHWWCPGQPQGCAKPNGDPCDGSGPVPPRVKDCVQKKRPGWLPRTVTPKPCKEWWEVCYGPICFEVECNNWICVPTIPPPPPIFVPPPVPPLVPVIP
jgi:RHS repeat-associated protein